MSNSTNQLNKCNNTKACKDKDLLARKYNSLIVLFKLEKTLNHQILFEIQNTLTPGCLNCLMENNNHKKSILEKETEIKTLFSEKMNIFEQQILTTNLEKELLNLDNQIKENTIQIYFDVMSKPDLIYPTKINELFTKVKNNQKKKFFFLFFFFINFFFFYFTFNL